MAGAAQLPQPGVEVIQEFASVSPTIVTPTLVPCVIAPYFEVIEALNSDGTVNDDAKLTDPYQQLELEVAQSSFPSPRGNIDEVDVTEDDIRVFFEFGGALMELQRDQAFHLAYNDPAVSTQPYVEGGVEPGGGYLIDGRTLIVQFNSHTAVPAGAANLPRSADVTITFSAAVTDGRISLTEVVNQINALIPGVASAVSSKLRLTSTRFGAHASVVVRKEGSANACTDGLGFSATDDQIAVGSGFYSSDDSDGDLVSPRIKVYAGTTQIDVGGADVPQVTVPNFNNDYIEIGDTVVADGVVIGDISIVESAQLTMEVEQNIMSHDNPFAPRRVWIRANDLSYPAPASSTAATKTGTGLSASAASAFIVAANAFAGGGVGASESFDFNIIEDGVALATETLSSEGGWADIATALTDIAAFITANSFHFEVYRSNDVGDEIPSTAIPTSAHRLAFRTKADNRGSGSGITLASQTTEDAGFTNAQLPAGDIGENVRFQNGTAAFAVGAGAFVGTTAAETIVYSPTVNGVAKSAETITWAATSAILQDAIDDWNSQALYTEAYKADSAGVESATGTYFAVRTTGENVGADAIINVTANDATNTNLPVASAAGTDADLNGTSFKWSIDNNPKVYEAFFVKDEDDDGTSMQTVINAINALTPNVAAESSDAPPYLKLTSNKVGEGSGLVIGDGTANTILGFTDNDTADGTGRPNPDLAIDINGDVVLQGQLLRDGLTGTPYNPASAPVIVAYNGLRLDLSPDADNPSLLVFNDTSAVEEAADPISTDNPGALMSFLALLNAPSVSIASIGVPDISADAPDGTLIGYAKCFEFIESEEVYALAVASQMATVHQAGLAHANSMSEPEQKGERIFFFNPEIPDRAVPTIVGSGTDANSTATANEVVLDVNIAPKLIELGIDPNADINPTTGAIENEVYLDLGSDDKAYLVQKVDAGITLTLRVDFEAGDGNDDAFFSSTDLPTGIISDDWSVFLRGDQLLQPGTTRPDRDRIAETIQTVASAYGFRRGFLVHPDQVGINVSGLEQVVPGYYATACVTGMVGELPPQQGFTNYPITGLTRVIGSNDQYTKTQLAVMAAGGVYILIQEAQGARVVCRHQLSTDTTSIETRELSITKVVDYTAKFMRAGLRNFIGRSNITQPFLDNLSTVVEGLKNFLVEGGVLIGASVNNIIQDADNPDTVLIDITLDIPYPCNYIRLTLIV